MKQSLNVTGLDCPVCAQQLEEILSKIEGVQSVKVLYPMGKISLEYSDVQALMMAKSAINGFEEVKVVEADFAQSADHKPRWVRILISALLLVAGMAVTRWCGFLKYGGVSVDKILSCVLYISAYLTVAVPVLLSMFGSIRRGRVFDENFLMSVASIGAFAIGEPFEGVLVMLLYQVGETLQSIAVGGSRKSLTHLMSLKTETATRLIEGGAETVEPERLCVGDKLLIKAGDKIPCDCILLTAAATLDVKSLTGESAPLRKTSGEELLAGCVNVGEAFLARVIRVYEDSAVAKILDMVENGIDSKSAPEKFITKFAKIYTPFICMLAVCVAVFPPIVLGILDGSYAYVDGLRWLRSALTLLVISCPCALVISVPLCYFVGIGKCAQQGILVKGAVNLDVVAGTKIAALDKTGTLTKGNFSIIGAYPQGLSLDDFLSICAALEEYSSHPIAGAFKHVQAAKRATSVKEFAGKGLKGEYDGKSALFGTYSFLEEEGYELDERFSGDTVLYLAYDGAYCGCLEIGDVIREESKELLSELKQLGIKSIMLTGDSPARAQKVANAIGMSAFNAGLLPSEKVEVMENLKTQGSVLYAGDGINDAPVMTAANSSVSMGSLGSAAAVEASDFVLISDSLSAIPQLIKTARKTKCIVLQNVIFSILMKAVFMVLGVFPWFPLSLAVFADVGVMLLAVFNSLRVMK